MLWAGALGAAAGLAAPGPPWPPSRPTPPTGASAVCGPASGAFGLVPRPFSAALRGPASPNALGFGPLRGAWPPVARLRPPPGAPAGALGLGALRPPSARGVSGLRSWARPAGLCGLRCARPWPVSGRSLRPSAPPPGPPGLRPAGRGCAPSGLLPPGGCGAWRRPCPPPPGVGLPLRRDGGLPLRRVCTGVWITHAHFPGNGMTYRQKGGILWKIGRNSGRI